MKLRDALPKEFFDSFEDCRANQYLDCEVITSFSQGNWPGKHRHVINWWILDNGYAVGWNENPAVGWTFPVIRIKKSV